MLLFVATFLCFLICWFSLSYMNTDKINEDSNHRFYGEFVLFAIGMFGMVLADNFLWLFIFWEIMGLLLLEGECCLCRQEGIPDHPRGRRVPNGRSPDTLRHLWFT
jgi:hypothetical protein